MALLSSSMSSVDEAAWEIEAAADAHGRGPLRRQCCDLAIWRQNVRASSSAEGSVHEAVQPVTG